MFFPLQVGWWWMVDGVNGEHAVAAVDLELGLEIVQTQHQTVWDFIVHPL